MNNTVDAEVIENNQALALRPNQEITPSGLFGASEPVAVIAKATSVANALKGVIVSQGLVSKISGKEYPRCEAWTLLGTMLGVFPVTVWTKQVEDGWEARVEARTKDGSVIGAAEAQCLSSEKNWANRDDFALRSMAQTRATAKCLRMPLGFVMTLAGFEATPAEEMMQDHGHAPSGYRQRPVNQPQRQALPTQQQRPPPTGAPAAQQPAAKELKLATAATRNWMITKLGDMKELAAEYFQKLNEPAVLLPNETLEHLPWEWIPISTAQLNALKDQITEFGNGNEPRHPYKPNPIDPTHQPKEKAKSKPAPAPSAEAGKNRDPEYFWDVICPIPHKGEKKAEYDKQPDTIRSLYHAMKTGDEAAQKRLWGFARNWKPEPRTVGDRTYPVSQADIVFREALDAFCDWEEKHSKDTVADAQQQELQPEEDDVPF
jgi:hypothetical protein